MEKLMDELSNWRRIEKQLLHEIETGAFPVGEKLPGENVLASYFGVTRTTLRRALGEMQTKGVLRIERGRGAFVARQIKYGLGRESSFKANLRSASMTPSAQILARLTMVATNEIAERLDISVGDTIFVFDTVGRASDIVVSVTRHHLPAGSFPGAETRVIDFAGMTEVYEMYGYFDTWRAYCEIEARLPTPDEAHRLEQSRTEPVLEVRSVKKAGDLPIDYTVARFAAGRVTAFFDN